MSPPPRLRFLVAEDNEQWRDIIVHILEVDYDLVSVVERGDQIIEAVQRLRPDLITLDISMPGQSGLNALPWLRAALPTAIIIVVSATATPSYIQVASLRGADGYVLKSRVLSDLMSTVASIRDRAGTP